jgi:Na+/H+ antiporter NhaD/arsenite permease-like protein
MGVEWDTLLFFAALFVVVEGVSEMGLLRYIATMLASTVAIVGVEGRQYVL